MSLTFPLLATKDRPPRCVIVVENLPVPFDRRVWQEANALKEAGWEVSVICPLNEQHPERFEEINGIAIYRHPLPVEARGKMGFIFEYACALFHETRLLLKIAFTRGFDVIQGCNPPDLIFLVAAPYKLFGKKYVFDHHDLCPELYVAKYGRRGFFHRLLLLAEKCTFRLADRVISANDTYRDIAIERGGRVPEDVTAVYSVPDRQKLRRVEPNGELRAGAAVVLGYLGIIADQDGVDHLIRMMSHIVHSAGRQDVRAVIVGDGPALASVKALTRSLGVAEQVTFTGYLRGRDLLAAISTFDIGIIPDPVNEYNDKISMNKVFEYSTLGIPSVSYDLSETRRLLGAVGTFAKNATPHGLAEAALSLIDDEERRRNAGASAGALAEEKFNWDNEARKYVEVYEALVEIRAYA